MEGVLSIVMLVPFSNPPFRRPRGWGPLATYLGFLLVFGGLTTGLVFLLLWMNGTVGESSSLTNYQYNATGIILFIFLGLLGLFINFCLAVWFLIATGCPLLQIEELQWVVKNAINEWTLHKKTFSKAEKLRYARVYFGAVLPSPDLHQGHVESEDDLIDAYETEQLLERVFQGIFVMYPELAQPTTEWAFNDTGDLIARQKMSILHLKEFACIWGVETEDGGYGGTFPLMEGDVLINGTMTSYEPDAGRSVERIYVPGDTSFMFNRQRRKCKLSKRCYMLSFSLYYRTNMLTCFFSALLIPYLCRNHDSKSFWIQFHDFYNGFWRWMAYRLYLTSYTHVPLPLPLGAE